MEPRKGPERSTGLGTAKKNRRKGQVCNFSISELSNDRKVDTGTLNGKSSSFNLERKHTQNHTRERAGNAHRSDFAGSRYGSVSSRGPALDGRAGKLDPVD